MTWFELVILAFVQGLTEFLPVSSSGHLAATRLLFGFSDASGTALDAFLHLGTLFAVLVYFRRVWFLLVRSVLPGGNTSTRRFLGVLLLATVPAAVVGFVLQRQADLWLRSSNVVVVGLLFTAAVLVVAELLVSRRGAVLQDSSSAIAEALPVVSLRNAFFIGVTQIFALVPGVSRSGVTMAAGWLRGLRLHDAISFSFLLSAPIIAGAGLASLPELWSSNLGFDQLVVGLLLSFGFGLVAISFLLKLVERFSFWPFVVYLIWLSGTVWYVG